MEVHTMITYDRSPDSVPEAFDAIVASVAGEAIVGLWWKVFLPRHFTPRGAQIYGYAPRSAKYQQRKLREKHHQDPFVWSGTTKAMTMGAIEITVESNKHFNVSVVGRMRAPHYVFTQRKQHAQMWQELLVTPSGERAAMIGFMQRRFIERVRLDAFEAEMTRIE